MKEAEDDENIEEEDVPVEKVKKVSHAKRKKQTQCKITWIGEPVQVLLPLLLWAFKEQSHYSSLELKRIDFPATDGMGCLFVLLLTGSRENVVLIELTLILIYLRYAYDIVKCGAFVHDVVAQLD